MFFSIFLPRMEKKGRTTDRHGWTQIILSPEVPPSGRGYVGAASVRRYLTLWERHLRLCTFASPRRAPSGHGGPCVHKSSGHAKTDGHGDLRARNLEVCKADLLNQHPGGVPAYSPGSQTPGKNPPHAPIRPWRGRIHNASKTGRSKGEYRGRKNALSNRR